MIFAKEANKYWAVGLPVIPLIEKEKRPVISRWQLFADAFPTQEEQNIWMTTYPNGNIGLPMGPSAGLVAVDIDTDDPTVLAILERILPDSPWVRVGKKGNIKVYKYNGERTTRIKHADGTMICEILSKGTQFVLPPSIHPETLKPYTANGNLYEMLDQVPFLPEKAEILIRDELAKAGIEVSVGTQNKVATFVPAGARDNAMVWHAGLLARAVLRGERSLLQALGEMGAWLEAFVEKVIGDPITVEKGQGKLVEFLIRDVTGERKMALPIGWDEGLTEEDKTRLNLTFTEDDESWDAERIMVYLTSEFERFPDFRDRGRLNAVNVTLDRITRSPGTLSALDEAMILRFIASQSANQMSQADLKKQLVSLRRGDINGDNQEEVARAVVQYLSKYGEIRFDTGAFWQWKGAYWDKKPDIEITKVIAEEFGNYPVCKRHSDYHGVMRVMMAIANKPMSSHEEQGLNFANGFLNSKLELVPHDPDYGMTYILPYRYMPDLAGHMPMFNQYLMDSWGDDADYGDKLLALQEAMGATLMQGTTAYQRAICLFGQPGSGKSQAMAVMMGLLPEESTSSIPPHDWEDKFLPAEMYGKVLNYAGELSESKNIPGNIFKQVVEGTPIPGQNKNMPPFKFKPRCAQWFSSNFKPKTRDSSDGFNRRWLFLEWNKRVEDNRKIPDLAQIILEHEREGIAAWAALGWARLKENGGYTLPTSHMAITESMAMDNNSVRYFLTTSTDVVVGMHRTKDITTAVELHGKYWNFCLLTGTARRESLQGFMRMMKELQPTHRFVERNRATKGGHSEMVYEGIGLAPK